MSCKEDGREGGGRERQMEGEEKGQMEGGRDEGRDRWREEGGREGCIGRMCNDCEHSQLDMHHSSGND